MPICPYAQIRLNHPLMPLCPTIHDCGNMPYARMGRAICHMPICPYAQIRLNSPLMPLCRTLHMGICHMPVCNISMCLTII